jgi:hypothetical protein
LMCPANSTTTILAGDNFLINGNPVIAAADGVYDDLLAIITNN